MSDETRGEDTILGTALSRAIESQPVRTTSFEQSRVALRMAGGRRSPLVPVLAAAAAIVLGLALGAALLGQRGPTEGGPVATQPAGSPGPTTQPTGAPVAEVVDPNRDRIWVYFARDQLPPAGATIGGIFRADSVASRIMSRIDALREASPDEIPSGSTNTLGLLGVREQTPSGSRGSFEMSVGIDGDLATVEFGPAGTFERVRGAAQSQALLEQLVYTITEEPGIRRALIKEKGKDEAVIDQLVIDQPLTREDVLPYEGVRTEQRVELQDDARLSETTIQLDTSRPEVSRFIVEIKANETPEGGFWTPRMIAEITPNDDPQRGYPGKWLLEISLDAAAHLPTAGDRPAESSPVRKVDVGSFPPEGRGVIYTLALDDARPWRVSLEPVTPGTMRLIVDIGGHPQAVSESVAVYGPMPGDEVPRTFTLTGTARAFEAHVAWRIKDSSEREVATGFVTASLGTSPVWGTFTTEVKVPDNVTGVVTLEVFWPSPQDGRDVGTVSIPLRVR